MSDFDPYRPPEAEVVERPIDIQSFVLAGRGTRLFAVILDSVFYVLCMVPFFVVMGVDPDVESPGAVAGILLCGVLGISLFCYQLVLLSQNGWTLGKRLLRIRIVRTDRSDAGLGRIFFLRMFFPWLLGALPYIGSLFSLLDALFIFGAERRCIHDHIADTIVVEA